MGQEILAEGRTWPNPALRHAREENRLPFQRAAWENPGAQGLRRGPLLTGKWTYRCCTPPRQLLLPPIRCYSIPALFSAFTLITHSSPPPLSLSLSLSFCLSLISTFLSGALSFSLLLLFSLPLPFPSSQAWPALRHRVAFSIGSLQ